MKEKIIALDIGGVCISLNTKNGYEGFQLPENASLPEEFLRACYLLETGRISNDEWLKVFRNVTGYRYTTARLLEIWYSMIGPDIPGMADAVRSLIANGFRFVYLSNTSEIHLLDVARKNGFGHLVTGGIYSFSSHSAKPDAKIYEDFEKEYGLPFAYFDDRAENVEAARQRGWNAHIYHSPEEFLKQVLADGADNADGHCFR